MKDFFEMPTEFALMQNTPNPFNPSTTITYSIPYDTQVKLIIYSIQGQKITVLKDEQAQAGTYSVTWNADELSSGIYFYTLITSDFINTKKMILLK